MNLSLEMIKIMALRVLLELQQFVLDMSDLECNNSRQKMVKQE